MPIRARLDMLATGIRTPVGVKIAGPDLAEIDRIGQQVERVLGAVPGTASVYAERTGSARYIDITIDRDAAARYWLSVDTLQDVVDTALMRMARRAVLDLRLELEGVLTELVRHAEQHRDTPMVARTLTQHAVPTTFGSRARWTW